MSWFWELKKAYRNETAFKILFVYGILIKDHMFLE